MGKKLNKKQKRAKKVSGKISVRKAFDCLAEQCHINTQKIALAFPNKKDRLDYVRALVRDFGSC